MVGTSAWFAAAAAADPHTRGIRGVLTQHASRCVTTNLIVGDFLTLARARRGPAFAVAAGRPLVQGRLGAVVAVGGDDERVARAIFQRWDRRRLSHADCATAAVMRRLRADAVLTLDADFASLGLPVWPLATDE